MARKILLADDSVTAQNMGRKILTDAGYEVVAVNNGSAALKKLAEQKPDIIVLDVYMPGYSGLEVCQRIKDNRETARIPVLLTVGKLEPFKPEEARRADAFVVKPFEASELLTAITKLEQKIGPELEPTKPGRFAKALAAIEESAPAEEKFGDSDGGWKSRLRFPSRKKKAPETEEPPEFVSTPRDVRDPVPFAPPAPAAERGSQFERPIPTGLPRDITPEEIAAITAAAAQLSGAPSAAPPVEAPKNDPHSAAEVLASTPPSVADLAPAAELIPAAQPAPEAVSAPAEAASIAAASPAPAPAETAEVPAAPVEAAAPIAIQEIASSAPASIIPTAIEEPAPATLADVPALEIPQTISEASSVTEMPALTAPIATSFEVVAAPVAIQPEIPAPVVVAAEPIVASAEPTPVSTPEPAPVPAEVAAAETPAPVEAIAVPEAPPAVPPVQDAEVMAVLQALGPAVTEPAQLPIPAEAAAVSSTGLAAVAHSGSNGHARWIAEDIPLTAEEASLSLEKEMVTALAAIAANEAAQLLANSAPEALASAQPVAEVVVAAATGSMIAVAEPAVVEAAPAPSEPAPAVSEPAAIASQPPAAEPAPIWVAVEPELATPAVPAQMNSAVVDQNAPVTAAPEPEPVIASQATDTAAVPESAEVAASVVPLSEAASVPENSSSDVAPQVVAAPVSGEPEISQVEDSDPMSPKHSENLGFKMIRQSPAGTKGAAKSAPVSKETFEALAAEPEQAAMAAAASAETAPPVPAPAAAQPAAASDAKAIASIVDSVLAELRPRIVEEIARKLAEPKKE